MNNMKVVIVSGGKGSRIASLNNEVAKPMIPMNGKPVLEYEIDCLRRQGFTDIILTVSHLKESIINYFGDGSKFGVSIEYFIEEEPLGNAGALFRIKDKLSETFLLLNADSIFDVDFNRFIAYHKQKGGLVTLFAHPNSHPYDSGLLIKDEDDSVKAWLTKEDARPTYYKNIVNAGLHVIEKRVLDVAIDTPKIDLDRQILKPLANTHQMFIYQSPEYVRDMGTPERFFSVENDLKKGIIASRNLLNKQKAIFLDRDGTINKLKGFLKSIDEFELIEGVSEAIKRINNSEYLAIVITNQPVIARGEVTFKELDEIHNKMETLLGLEGSYLDDIYYCPHHPDKGYDGEVKELKIECDCRKPKPGMIFAAAKKYNIDLSSSYMIGDGKFDVLCAKAAGVTSILLSDDPFASFGADMVCSNLLDAINNILKD